MPKAIRIVALDTQVFHQESFNFGSRRMRELQDQVNKGHVRIAITDVTEREVRTGITRLAHEGADALRKKDLKKAIRALTSFPEYGELVKLQDGNANAARLLQQFDQFIKDAAVEIVKCGEVQVGPILEKYFEVQPPFENTEAKKSEFPDAISVAGLDYWAENNGTVIEVVSGDQGVQQACTRAKRLHPVASLAQLLANVTAAVEGERRVEQATQAFHAQTNNISRQVADAFMALPFSIDDDDYFESDVSDVTIDQVLLGRPLLTHFESATHAEFEVEVMIRFSAEVNLSDPNATVYDREDGEFHVFNTIRGEVTNDISVPAMIELRLAEGGKEAMAYVRSVNNGDTVSVGIEKFRERASRNDE